ncbi:MAG TPA: ABC transporter permease [Pyrinomonadaceae bacterium]
MERLWQDLQYSFRTLWKKPSFTIVAIVTLALGIGANAAIFSMVNGMLFRSLPYPKADRLVMVWETNQRRKWDMMYPSYPNFADWRDQNTVFEDMAAYVTLGVNFTNGDQPERVYGAAASASLFKMLDAQPILGRSVTPDDDKPGAEPTILISYGLWQRLNSDPNIVGKTVEVQGVKHTVLGVMPQGFEFPPQFRDQDQLQPKIDMWGPMRADPNNREGRGSHSIYTIALLKPGVSLEQARAEMTSIAGRLAQEYPGNNKDSSVRLIPLNEQVVGDVKPVLLVLLGVVAFVLLIACANVANLLLARATSRQKEIAVRVAMGASRGRIIRQLLTESLLLSIISGGIGLLLAIAGVRLLVALSPDPRMAAVGVNLKILGVTMLVSVITGVLFGLAPSVLASQVDPNKTLKESTLANVGGTRHRLRKLLAVSEIALALVLLVGAGMMIRTFMKMQNTKLGFSTDNVTTMRIATTGAQYAESFRSAAFFQQLVERLKTIPGTQAVGVTNVLPLSGEFGNSFKIEGPPRPQGEIRQAEYRAINSDYFRAMGIPLQKGRVFTERDTKEAPGVVIVNETFANRYFPNEDALGKRLHIDTQVELATYGGKTIPREIVGVVADLKNSITQTRIKPEMYVPYLQNPHRTMTVVMSNSSDQASLASSVRSEVRSLDANLPVFNIKTMAQLRDEQVAQQRFFTLLLSMFAVVALVLAIVGIYGVLAYSVSQRTREIGIRMALGAHPSDVLKMVLKQGMWLVSIGLFIGLAAAIVLTRVVYNMVYGAGGADVVTFVGVSLVMILAALSACYISARKATKVDPLKALQFE